MKTEKIIEKSIKLSKNDNINYAIEISFCCQVEVFYRAIGPLRLNVCSCCGRQWLPLFVIKTKK